MAFKIHILWAIEPATWESLKILVQGAALSYATEVTAEGTCLLSGNCEPPPGADLSEPVELTFEMARTRRPADIGTSSDRRRLGIAVNWVEIGPA
jgi:hypothetical protein